MAFCENEYEVATGADALVIATEWNQFRSLDFERLGSAMRRRVLVDLRNIYQPAEARARGFKYEGIGRASHAAVEAGQGIAAGAKPEREGKTGRGGHAG